MTIRHFLSLALSAATCFLGMGASPARADDSAKMALSANENYLRRFQKERELVASATDEASLNKRQSLDQKIQNLQIENKRLAALAGSPQPASSVPVVPPVAAPANELQQPKPEAGKRLAVSEWEAMNREAKEKYVQGIVESLKKEGRIIERHPLFYTALMDYVFVSNGELASKTLKEAVLATIQKNERSFQSTAAV